MQTAKQRHFEKIYANALWIECGCGCGTKIKNKDKYGRDKHFENGHNGRKYGDVKEHKRQWRIRNKAKLYAYKLAYYRKRKAVYIKFKGGKCMDCFIEYNGKNGAIFQFDHREPEHKLFQLGNQFTNRSIKIIYEELEKCDLVCGNCHALRTAKAEY